jgi:hypothetical protein
MLIFYSTDRELQVPQVPAETRSGGLGWSYERKVLLSAPSGRYAGLHTVSVHFAVLIILAVLFAFYPALAFIRGPLRRRRRPRKGLCIKCGYDLTGNESGICPECGTEVKRS